MSSAPEASEHRSMQRKLTFKLFSFFLILFFILLLILGLIFRQLAINSAKTTAITIAETTKDGLTALMALEVIDQKDIYIENILQNKELSGINDIQILKGESVIRQFGSPKEIERPQSQMELLALRTGELQEEQQNFNFSTTYSIVIPFKASSKGSINCMNCHLAQEGEVLGAISFELDLKEHAYYGLNLLLLLLVSFVLMMLGGYFVIQRFFQPYIQLFNRLNYSFSDLQKGQFDTHVYTALDDEAGLVSQKFNAMCNKLQESFQDISKNTFFLVGRNYSQTGHLVNDTMANVNQLVSIYNFKREVEQQDTSSNIYELLKNAFHELGLQNFTFYEAHIAESRFSFVLSSLTSQHRKTDQGEVPPAPDLTEILNERPLNCTRNNKSNHQCPTLISKKTYNSFKNNCWCSFIKKEEDKNQGHICLPVIGNTMAIVGQFVIPKGLKYHTDHILPLIRSYFHEVLHNIEIKNAMNLVHEQSITDQLTGLKNRHYLEQFSGKIFPELAEQNVDVGFLILDLDHFKNTNDEFGHMAGDQVLIKVAKTIKLCFRKQDVCIRLGGEEFLVIMPGISAGQADVLAEKLRKKIEDLELSYEGKKFQKTASIGCAEYPRDSPDFWFLIKYADDALYHAKENGRNQVSCYQKIKNLKSK